MKYLLIFYEREEQGEEGRRTWNLESDISSQGGVTASKWVFIMRRNSTSIIAILVTANTEREIS